MKGKPRRRTAKLSLAVCNWMALNSCAVMEERGLYFDRVVRIGRPQRRYLPGWAVAEIDPRYTDAVNIALLEQGLAEALVRERLG